MGDCKVYVGGLPTEGGGASEVRIKEDLEEAFSRYGRLRKVWVARRPPGFAFIEFEDVRDAEDSVRALDGSRIQGARIKVELSHGRRRDGDGGRGGGGGRFGGGGGGRRRSPSPRYGRGGGRSRSRSPRRSRSPPPRRGGAASRSPRSRSPPPRRDRSKSRSRSRS